MMFHRPGLIKKNQRGFTLLEIMLAMVISGLIAAAISGAIFQLVMGNASSKNHMTALKQVQSAGYWVSHDAQMAQTVVPSNNANGFPLTLLWTDSDGTSYNATYTLDPVSRELKRQLSENDTPTKTAAVARFIDSAKTNCRLSGSGTFNLPDSGDTFTISGGAIADSGRIVVSSGSISVTVSNATYSGTSTAGGDWTIPAGDTNTIVVSAKNGAAAGGWFSDMASATVAITNDVIPKGNAAITGDALVFTVTATVGTGRPQQTEKRVYNVTPRPGS